MNLFLKSVFKDANFCLKSPKQKQINQWIKTILYSISKTSFYPMKFFVFGHGQKSQESWKIDFA